MKESIKPTRLYLARHGEVVAQGQKTFLGFTDLGLSPEGERQIRALAKYLKGISLDRAYASNLIRAVASARSICRGRVIQPLTDPAFREMNMGDWDGKTWEEIKQKHPELSPYFFYNLKTFRFPGGETWGQFRTRVLRGLRDVLKKDQGKNILLAAHAGVNRIILAQALGLRFRNMFCLDQAYACLNIIEYYGSFSRVILMNATFYNPSNKRG
jgi:broad specificity phosphatase PhoE